jgi:hypothetical protein
LDNCSFSVSPDGPQLWFQNLSVIGIIVLTVTVRKIFHDDDDKEDSETFEFPKYAQLHDEEFLNDAHI